LDASVEPLSRSSNRENLSSLKKFIVFTVNLNSANEQIHLLTSSEEKRTAEHRNLLDASAKQNEALHKENEALNEELRENDNAMHILEEKLRVTSNAAGFGTVTQEAHDKEITELTAQLGTQKLCTRKNWPR